MTQNCPKSYRLSWKAFCLTMKFRIVILTFPSNCSVVAEKSNVRIPYLSQIILPKLNGPTDWF